MSYSEFAYWYDELNNEANYNRLASSIEGILAGHGIEKGIVADLGCGTGEVSLRLAKHGYDMICVDQSADMLTVFREKIQSRYAKKLLLLQQNLADLDLYGTIQAAVSTFDTLNHLPQSQLEKALGRISLFLEPGGVFVFDANTPYKHAEILAINRFEIESRGREGILTCTWNNRREPGQNATRILLDVRQNGKLLFSENFLEYAYPLEFWHNALQKAGFAVEKILDGESFTELEPTSQRYLVTAIKL
ncbi:MAG: class I SAM-dependent DNA methyltransferase [Oscillospiraceae bacterium]